MFSANGKTSVRAGYALRYVDDQMVEVTDGFTVNNPGLQAYPANFDLSGTVSNLPPIPVRAVSGAHQFRHRSINLNPAVYYTLMNPHLQTALRSAVGLSIQQEIEGHDHRSAVSGQITPPSCCAGST